MPSTISAIIKEKLNSNLLKLIKTSSSYNIKHTDDNFEEFCPGVGKTIDCSPGLIKLNEGFYGISSETPAVCV